MLVDVLNGTGAPGQATEVATALQAAGFAVEGTGNAASFENAVTIVAYPPEGQAAAHVLASHLVGDYELRLDDDMPAGAVDLVVGESWDGLRG